MFTIAERDAVRDSVLELASADARVLSGAVGGSLALGPGDRWSDLDLTFAVADGMPLTDVLDDWTERLSTEFGAVTLFDLPAGASIYRVLLLPGCLQVDLSVTPAATFAPRGRTFRLLFGSAKQRLPASPRPAAECFGYAVHHALRARFSIERGRGWQAEYWISGVRDEALALACLRRGLPGAEGRGFDELPAEALDGFAAALVRSLEREELLRALRAAVTVLVREAEEVRDLAAAVEHQLRELTASPLSV